MNGERLGIITKIVDITGQVVEAMAPATPIPLNADYHTKYSQADTLSLLDVDSHISDVTDDTSEG